MNKTRDFTEFYGISDALAIGTRAVECSDSASQAASLAMRGTSEHGKYKIKRTDNPQNILFGRFDQNSYGSEYLNTIAPTSKDLLTMYSGKLPVVALRYGIYPQEFVIGYVQSHALLNTLESFQDLKEDLGNVRPHELLVAHFLARAAPALDKHPETGVFVSPFYVDKPLYPRLRDRFFDKQYSLNPNRERVRQILGEDNSWLTQTAIESRKERLTEIIEGRKSKTSPRSRLGRFLFGDGDVKVMDLQHKRTEWPRLII